MPKQLSHHNLGRTSLRVTRMGLGLAALGRPGYINLNHGADLPPTRDVASMEAHSHQVLDSAWAAGIRYFDAARSYGRSEQFLASWLEKRAIRPGQVTVGSKWGYTYTADWQIQAEHHEIKEHSLPVLQRQIQESRGWLGQYLGLYQIHSATLDSGVLDNTAVLSKLARLKEEGLAIGLSLSGSEQVETLEKAMDVEVAGRPLFETVQVTWNLLEPSASEVLQGASDAGMGIIVKEALANGRLSPRNREPAFAEKMALFQQVAREQETTIDALALAAAIAQPWASVVLSGAASPEQLQSNVAAFQVSWTKELAGQLAPLAETPAVYWRVRSQLAWN